MTARLPKFVPALNVPQIVAIMAIPGRLVPSNFGPTEVVFDLVDGRPWYVPQVIADEIYAAGFQARQQLEVTAVGKKKTEVRIIPVQQRIQPLTRSAAPAVNLSVDKAWPVHRESPIERDYTPELEKSLHQVAGPEPYWADTAMQTAPAHGISNDSPNTGNGTAPSALDPPSAGFMGGYKAAIDVLLEAQAYAKRQGLLLNIECEDVRCLAATMMIQAGGR